eukprot:TRINITY_DN30546_c0_g1_i1.p1 TRINITY_DN30546_c0_g1~~TRINITY_DN30546_c0_g1_i1.p1  ORF type:complete len:567 (+),score=131.81 TRINITY_DN30546_c0_g1_i1:63-1763(+)
MMKQTNPLLLSVRSQMLVEKMNAFYLKNWDREIVFDISQRVVPRHERHWHGKLAPRMTGSWKNWRYTYTHTPYHKSDDGQSPGDIMTKNVKKKYFWVDPPADMYLEKNVQGSKRDYHLAWEEFYKELESAAYSEPEQVLTLLNDLTNEGWSISQDVYERADILLEKSRERRALGIRPPITLQEVKGKERWPGNLPIWEEEWDPVLAYSINSQANPAHTYKPLMENDWVHDPAPWKDGPLPYPQLTQMEERLEFSPQRKNIILQKEADTRHDELLTLQNKDIYQRWVEDPSSFAGSATADNVKFLEDNTGKEVLKDGIPLLLHTDINHFIELFYPGDNIPEALFLWKYTADHVMFRHFVFEKTGKTLLEYTEPERFAILHAILDVKKALLFESEIGGKLTQCWTDSDYIEAFGEDDYRSFLRMDGRRIDEERRKYLRLWSTETVAEERLDQVVELTRMRHEDEYATGIYGGAARVKDRLDRKKWAIKEPSRQVQEHEKLISETAEERRALFDDEMALLAAEAELTYGDEVYGRMSPKLSGSGKVPDPALSDEVEAEASDEKHSGPNF